MLINTILYLISGQEARPFDIRTQICPDIEFFWISGVRLSDVHCSLKQFASFLVHPKHPIDHSKWDFVSAATSQNHNLNSAKTQDKNVSDIVKDNFTSLQITVQKHQWPY